LPERDDEVAVIAHLRRRRQFEAAAARQIEEFVAACGHANRRRVLTPFGPESVERRRVHDRAGQRMGAETRALFEQANAEIGFQLLEADGRREARRTPAHDRHLIFHYIALIFGHGFAPVLKSPATPTWCAIKLVA
jgi:hypothetical protein